MSGRAATTSIIPGRYAISVGDANMPTPRGWSWTILSKVARLETGHTPSRSHPEYWEGGDIAWIGIKDARIHNGKRIFQTLQQVTQAGIDNSASRKLPAGTVCLSRTASVGYVLVMGREMATSQDFVNWVCSDALVPEFLMYALMAEGEDIRRFGKGTTHTTIYFPEVKAFHICLPPIPEQRRIVAKIEELFSDLDAGVAALTRAKANLKRYRASVLKAAVEGHLTADWRAEYPDTEPASALLARILTERRQKWEAAQLAKFAATGKSPPKNWKDKYPEPSPPDTTNLPDLPDGWCWATLPQLGLVDRGRSRNRPRNAPHLYGGPYPFVQTGDIRHADTFVRTYEQTYSEAGLKQSKLWPEGTLCITIAANIAETAILGFAGCFPDSVVGFVPSSDDVSVRYVELYFRTIQERLEAIAPATAQKNLNLESLNQVAICLPPVDEQRQIVAEVDERLSIVRAAESLIETNGQRAARLRQSILKQAFEGKLVPQDPGDEPASRTLKKLRRESPTARTNGRTKLKGSLQ